MRFPIKGFVADAFDQQALRLAFRGCEVVVHAVAGDFDTIIGTIDPVYCAAEAEGVRRIVYLSSASVHGQSPSFGTSEESPLNDRQPVEYNNAKVRAERRLLQLRRRGPVDVVMLRPGIVFGPRSYWTGGFADELVEGHAYLVEGGRGICNSAYVDNVVHAIYLAMRAPEADGQAYLIGDAETVTWADLCKPIADALGYELAPLNRPAAPHQHSLHRLNGLRALRRFAVGLPAPLYYGIKAARAAWRAQQNRPMDSYAQTHDISVTLERTLLHKCATKLSFGKAARELGYSPIVSFEDGCRRSVSWLKFAGYPVRKLDPDIYDDHISAASPLPVAPKKDFAKGL
jgi:nucleoside-diphosphate-sugar epimerase